MTYYNFVIWGNFRKGLEEIDKAIRKIGLVYPSRDKGRGSQYSDDDFQEGKRVWVHFNERGERIFRIHATICPESLSNMLFRYWLDGIERLEKGEDPMLDCAKKLVKRCGLKGCIVSNQVGMRLYDLEDILF